jgi:MinD-like ATPase involved in chromosome partitioning or flagellar assembly
MSEFGAAAMNRSISVLVGGAPGLAEVLRTTGRFARVISCGSTSEMKELIGKNLLGEARPDSFVFIFSPLMAENVPGIGVDTLVTKLTADDFRVVVLDTDPRAKDLVRRNPAAGLFSPPFTANTVLGGLSGTGIGLLEPISESWAHASFDPTDEAAARALVSQSSAAPFSEPAAAWGTEPAPVQPVQQPWGASPVPEQPAQSTWGSELPAAAGQPQSSAPQPGAGWDGQIAAPPAWGNAPAPAQPAQGGWGEQPTQPAWGSEPASVQPAWGEAPAQPAQSGWGDAPTSNGWGDVSAASGATPSANDEQAAAPAWGTEQAPEPSTWGNDSPAPVQPAWGSDPQPAQSWEQQPAPPAPAWGQEPAPAWGAEPAPSPAAPAWGTDPQPASSWGEQTGWGTAATPAASNWGTITDGPQLGGPAPLQGAFAPAPAVARRGYVMAVAVAKGGAGKSTLALNLGVWLGLRLRQAGKTVCVVDANYQQADIGKQLHRYSPNIVTLAKNPQDQDVTRISQHLLHMPNLNTTFLLGPTGVDDANPLWITPQLYSHAVEVLRQLFDYVIIDTPVAEFHNEIFDQFVLNHSDYILVPVTPDIVTLQSTDNWLQGITASKHQGGKGFERDRIGIVLNMAAEGVGMDESDVQRNLASWNFLGSVPSSRVWQAARNEEEIVATRNYAEVNASFSRILGNATGDPDIVNAYVPQPTQTQKSGRRLFKKKG